MKKVVCNAKDAHDRADSCQTGQEEREYIMKKITVASEQGEYGFYVRHALRATTLEYLESLNFVISSHSSLAQQKDSLYYTIEW